MRCLTASDLALEPRERNVAQRASLRCLPRLFQYGRGRCAALRGQNGSRICLRLKPQHSSRVDQYATRKRANIRRTTTVLRPGVVRNRRFNQVDERVEISIGGSAALGTVRRHVVAVEIRPKVHPAKWPILLRACDRGTWSLKVLPGLIIIWRRGLQLRERASA